MFLPARVYAFVSECGYALVPAWLDWAMYWAMWLRKQIKAGMHERRTVGD